MASRKYVKLFLIPATVALLIQGCITTGLLPKSEELLAAEQFYQETSNNPKVKQHAASELKKAGSTLNSAVKAKTEEEMAHYVYISNNQINTAIETAELNATQERIREIKALKYKLKK